MLDSSNMTNAEFYKVNGTLSARRIEALLEREESIGMALRCLDKVADSSPGDPDLNEVVEALNDALTNDRHLPLVKAVKMAGDFRDRLEQFQIEVDECLAEARKFLGEDQ